MTQYIDKTALVAEIEKLKSVFVNERDGFEKGYHYSLNLLISFLDTLEIKEVDLEREIARVSKNEYFDFTDWKSIARHFFELGLAQKGE